MGQSSVHQGTKALRSHTNMRQDADLTELSTGGVPRVMETKCSSHKIKPHGAKLKPGVLSCVRANRGKSPRPEWA